MIRRLIRNTLPQTCKESKILMMLLGIFNRYMEWYFLPVIFIIGTIIFQSHAGSAIKLENNTTEGVYAPPSY